MKGFLIYGQSYLPLSYSYSFILLLCIDHLLNDNLLCRRQSMTKNKWAKITQRPCLGGSVCANILRSRVQIPRTPSSLIPFIQSKFCAIPVCHCVGKRTKIKEKRPGLAHLKNKKRLEIIHLKTFFNHRFRIFIHRWRLNIWRSSSASATSLSFADKKFDEKLRLKGKITKFNPTREDTF